jgi:NADH-quinone oxidoreductase subunit C
MLKEIGEFLVKNVNPDAIIELHESEASPWIEVNPVHLTDIFESLRDSENHFFDFLNSITGVHLINENKFSIVYHLTSIPFNKSITLKVFINVKNAICPTISEIHKGADWHEREIFDLFGITFTGHKNLKRILLPDDWVGHPLRKDYQTEEFYKGIKIDYENSDKPSDIF